MAVLASCFPYSHIVLYLTSFDPCVLPRLTRGCLDLTNAPHVLTALTTLSSLSRERESRRARERESARVERLIDRIGWKIQASRDLAPSSIIDRSEKQKSRPTFWTDFSSSV